MFDATSKLTFANATQWVRDVRRMCEDIPIVLCCNKVDIADRMVTLEYIHAHPVPGVSCYCDISAKSNFHADRPLQKLEQMMEKSRKAAAAL